MDPTDQMFDETVKLTNPAYFAYFYKKILLDDNRFFEQSVLSNNMYESIVEMCKFFDTSTQLNYQVIHLVDRFYKSHLLTAMQDYKEVYGPSASLSDSGWYEVLMRIKKQIPLRIMTCIYTLIKHGSRTTQISIKDCLYVMSKYGYFCSVEKFKKAQMRLLRETSYDLETVTLLDYVTCLLTYLKYNINLNCDFYFPHVYNVIDLIYACEFMFNDEKQELTYSSRSFLAYACVICDIIPVIMSHPRSNEIFNELVEITKRKDQPKDQLKIEPTDLVSLRLKFLNLILKEKINFNW